MSKKDKKRKTRDFREPGNNQFMNLIKMVMALRLAKTPTATRKFIGTPNCFSYFAIINYCHSTRWDFFLWMMQDREPNESA